MRIMIQDGHDLIPAIASDTDMYDIDEGVGED